MLYGFHYAHFSIRKKTLRNLFFIKEELDKYITSAEVHDKELWLQIKERVQHLETFVYSIQDGI